MRRARNGNGTVYRRKDSQVWWIQFYVGGKRTCVSSGTADRREAEKILRARLTAAEARAEVQSHEPEPEPVTLERLALLILADYKANDRKSGKRVDLALRHLTAFFGKGAPAGRIKFERMSAYVAQRLEQA